MACVYTKIKTPELLNKDMKIELITSLDRTRYLFRVRKLYTVCGTGY